MENIIEVVKIAKNRYNALKILGWDTHTYGYNKLNKFIVENNIDISHFIITYNTIIKKIPINEILVSGSTYSSTSHLKRRLYKEGLKKRICEKCGQNEIWCGNKISLILDHINGINNDNRIENLRILCPNCNASLPTHCGRNSKRNKKKKINNRDSKKDSSIKQQRVQRPPYEQLLSEVSNLGYSGTGRKYNVSDNAVRKWIIFYEKYN